MTSWLARLGLVLSLSLASFGCAEVSPASEARRDWLVSTLTEDNFDLLVREPALVQAKYTLMATDLFRFFRGTAGQYFRDVTTPGPGYLPTAFATSTTSRVLLVGDPHLENIGTMRGEGGLIVGFNDFDAARFGPFHLDVRRLATSWWIAAQLWSNTKAAPSGAELVSETVRGYAEAIEALAQGRSLPDPSRGAVLADLLTRAGEDARTRSELFEYTAIDEQGRRVLSLPPPLPSAPLADAFRPLTDEEERLTDALLREHSTDHGLPATYFARKDAWRRLGSGVASFANLRLYWLVEGATTALEDDVIIEAKEARDPFPLPGLPLFPPRSHLHNAERIVQSQAALSEPLTDPHLDAVGSSQASFRLREVTGDQKGLRVSRLGEGLIAEAFPLDEFLELARTSGALLAASHARAPRLDGGSALDAIAETLAGRHEAFLEEMLVFAPQYGDLLAQ
ncbi:MAG: DUF2252 family protein, partial [Myxococcota bacterium]